MELQKRLSLPAHRISVQIDGPSWETIRGIPVDQEGLTLYPLLPKINHIAHVLVCEVSLEEKTKKITLRSPNVVCNKTLMNLEMIVTNDEGKKVGDVSLLCKSRL